MCPPLIIPAAQAVGTWAAANATAIMAVTSIASAGAGIYGQKQTAKAQAAQIAEQAANEREEVGAAAEEELGDRIKDSRARRARARVAAGESGALGASFMASINQSLSDTNMDAAKIAKGVAFKTRGIDDRANVALSGIRDPSALEAGLQIVGAGMSGMRSGLAISELSKSTPKEPGVE